MIGNATGKRPSRLNVVAYYKFDAWSKLHGKSKQEAKMKFIKLFKKIAPKDPQAKL